MGNILQQICDKRREDVIKRKKAVTPQGLLRTIQNSALPRGFAHAITHKVQNHDIALIAEVKHASPSQGIIQTDFDPIQCATAYEKAGATCLSVLTEPHWFKGQDHYIEQIKSTTSLPVLRKDFMVDPYQIIESRALGADCVLIILAALDDHMALDMCQTAQDLGLSILVEVHDHAEQERAFHLPFDMFGINNRNLKTMEINIETSISLAQHCPKETTIVSESGLNTHTDLQKMTQHGIYSFLVGTSLMRQSNLEQATRTLLGQ